MQTIAVIADPGAAAHYFEGQTQAERRVDPATGAVKYFTEYGDPPGRWHGGEAFGLEGIAKAGALQAILEGRDPQSGEPLLEIQPNHPHRAGWDLTYSAPKSVSAAWAVADPELRQAIAEAHESAVAAAKNYLDENAGYTRRGHGGEEYERVKLIGIEYQHAASRAQDPHLHSHLIIANMAQREDGSWGTIDPQPLYQQRMAAGSLYQAELSSRLRHLGFSIKPAKGGTFEIEGISKELRTEWSKRHESMGTTGQSKEAEAAFKKDRPDKARVSRDELFARWATEAQVHQVDPEKIRDALAYGPSIKPPEGPDQVDWLAVREKLVADRSTFQQGDLIRALAITQNSYASGRSAQEIRDLAAGALSVGRSGGMVCLGADDRGQKIFTTEEHLERERAMLATMQRLAQSDAFAANAELVTRAVEKEQEGGWHLSPEQQTSVRALATGSRLATLRGAAGAGKTTSMISLKEAYEGSGYKLVGATISNQAARVLEQDSGIKSTSVSKLLYELSTPEAQEESRAAMAWDAAEAAKAEADEDYEVKPYPGRSRLEKARDHLRAGIQNKVQEITHPHRPGPPPLKPTLTLDDRTVIVIDEAGMVDTPQLARLMEHADKAGAKIILVGDQKQLQSIGAGGGFAAARAITRVVGADAELVETRRQKQAWQAQAAADLSEGRGLEALQAYDAAGRLTLADGADEAAHALVKDWIADRLEDPKKSQLIMVSSHAECARINRLAQSALREHGQITGDQPVAAQLSTSRHGLVDLYEGDRIAFRSNSKGKTGIGVINGDQGTVLGVKAGKVQVQLDTGKTVAFDPQAYRNWALAYAGTVHKSQGSTVARGYYLIGTGDRREMGYVAASRQKEDLRLYVDKSLYDAKLQADPEALLKAIGRSVSKSDAKELAVDASRKLAAQAAARQQQQQQAAASLASRKARQESRERDWMTKKIIRQSRTWERMHEIRRERAYGARPNNFRQSPMIGHAPSDLNKSRPEPQTPAEQQHRWEELHQIRLERRQGLRSTDFRQPDHPGAEGPRLSKMERALARALGQLREPQESHDQQESRDH